jgi:hypothetical protein
MLRGWDWKCGAGNGLHKRRSPCFPPAASLYPGNAVPAIAFWAPRIAAVSIRQPACDFSPARGKGTVWGPTAERPPLACSDRGVEQQPW